MNLKTTVNPRKVIVRNEVAIRDDREQVSPLWTRVPKSFRKIIYPSPGSSWGRTSRRVGLCRPPVLLGASVSQDVGTSAAKKVHEKSSHQESGRTWRLRRLLESLLRTVGPVQRPGNLGVEAPPSATVGTKRSWGGNWDYTLDPTLRDGFRANKSGHLHPLAKENTDNSPPSFRGPNNRGTSE